MKKKTIILGIFLTTTLIVSSFVTAHLSKVAALREYHPLDGICIGLDAGHGGKDGGTRSGNIEEDDVNLQITRKLEEKIKKAGGKVILTRSEDKDLASEQTDNRKKEDMKKRMEIMIGEQVDVFLSIHLNAYPDTNVKGAQVFYKADDQMSETFAKIVQKHLKQATGSGMEIKKGDYYILNNAKNIGILVECGFLSNPDDRDNLVKKSYQEKIAQALYDSIREYFRILDE